MELKHTSINRKVDISNCLIFCFDILNALIICNELKKEAIKIELRIDIRIKNLIIYSDELKINQGHDLYNKQLILVSFQIDSIFFYFLIISLQL